MVNPIGSQDPADFKVNVGNLDKAMNDQTSQSWTDRFGADRLTWFGIETKTNEAINGLAFQIPVDYAAGLNVNTKGFTVTYSGVVYAPQPSAVPFTTGAWDAAQWYPIQNVLNQKNLLVFDTYAEASAAAATLPDGQFVIAEGYKYKVLAGGLIDPVNLDKLRADITEPTGVEPVGGFAGYALLQAYSGNATRTKIIQGLGAGVFERSATPLVEDGVLVIHDALGRSWKRVFSGNAHINWWVAKYPNHIDAIAAAITSGVPISFEGAVLNLVGAKTVDTDEDVHLNFSGATVNVGDCQLFVRASRAQGTLTLTSSVSRGSRGINVSGDISDIEEGDLLHIISNDLPSPDWADKKQDCVLIKQKGSGSIAFYDQLNFPYTSGEAGLTITVYKRRKLSITGLNSFHTHDASPTYIGFQGFAQVDVNNPSFNGSLPFDPVSNIYRTGLLLDRCQHISIVGHKAKNMAYPIGIYGGSRHITETGTTGAGNRHLNADIGGWSSDYQLVGMVGSGNYQGFNTHPCLRANASDVILRGELGLSNWRACGGFTLENIRMSGYADDTMGLPQFANTPTNPGFEYLNSEADIRVDGLKMDHPSRVTKPVFAVRFGRTAYYAGVETGQEVWAGLSGGELATFVQGPGCRIGSTASAIVTPSNILATNWRMDVPAQLMINAASVIKVPAGNVTISINGATKITTINSSGAAGQAIRLYILSGGGGLASGGNITGTIPSTPSGGYIDLLNIGGGQFLVSPR